MKQKIVFCILLMLLSSVDVALAKGKKKKARKVQRTEMYEEIDNFDFLYSNDYDVNMSFASTDDILSQATSFIGTRYRLGNRDHTPSTARASPVMSMVRTTSRLVVPPVTSMPATSPSARRRCSPATWCSSPVLTPDGVSDMWVSSWTTTPSTTPSRSSMPAAREA